MGDIIQFPKKVKIPYIDMSRWLYSVDIARELFERVKQVRNLKIIIRSQKEQITILKELVEIYQKKSSKK